MPNKQKLELTWIGKDKELKLEPRILLEDIEKSYGDKSCENMLIHGDNLLALKALEQDYTGMIKCIYIDPPYNTGNAFEHYDDSLEHSIWLDLIQKRLRILHKLLSKDGLLWIHLDYSEVHYCKILLDDIFGRDNFVGQITYERSSVGGIGQGGVFVNTGEYILVYKKEELKINEIFSYQPIDLSTMKRYNKFLKNSGERVLVNEFISKSNGETVKIFKHVNFEIGSISFKNYEKNKEAINNEYILNFNSIFRTFLVQKENSFQQDLLSQMNKQDLYSVEYIPSRGKYKDTLTNLYYLNKELIGWLKDSAYVQENEIVKLSKLTNVWVHSEIPKADLANEGGVSFPRGKKPEQLLKRIIEMSTNENDWVLDAFLGSGTSVAVAHKMKRRWIGVELGDHCYTHCIPRMLSVIDGTDQTGISKLVNWNGGSGFKFYEVAPSLLKKDKYNNWVIDERYSSDMLAAAVAKQEGFKYMPDQDVYWKQGQSNEKDFIFTTTNFITVEYLDKIHEEMQPNESLLICCTAFQDACKDRYPNITLKKIPGMLLGRCEFGRNDYSLNVAGSTPDNEADIDESGVGENDR